MTIPQYFNYSLKKHPYKEKVFILLLIHKKTLRKIKRKQECKDSNKICEVFN